MDFLPQNLSAITANEVIALSGIFLACLILSFILGKSRMTAFNLSFYPSILIYLQFPILDRLIFFKETAWQIFLNSLGIFLLFFFLTFLIINAITGKSLTYSSRKKAFQLIVLALSAWILILLLILEIALIPNAVTLLPITSPLFSSEKFFFWLLSVPLVLILLFVRK